MLVFIVLHYRQISLIATMRCTPSPVTKLVAAVGYLELHKGVATAITMITLMLCMCLLCSKASKLQDQKNWEKNLYRYINK